MTSPHYREDHMTNITKNHNTLQQKNDEPLKRIIIKQELVELTGDFINAVILNQIIFRSKYAKYGDQLILEEQERAKNHGSIINMPLSCGWIYKTCDDLSEETMLNITRKTMRSRLLYLIEKGWLMERRNPQWKYDKTIQYRPDLNKIRQDLAKLGYALDGFRIWEDDLTCEEIYPMRRVNLPILKRKITQAIPKVVKGTKENIYKKENQNAEQPTSKPSLEDNFEEVWNLYGNKKDRKNALQAYKKSIKITSHQEILKGIEKYLSWVKENTWYNQKLLATWLNGECWNDDLKSKDHTTNGSQIGNRSSVEYQRVAFEEIGKLTEPNECKAARKALICEFGLPEYKSWFSKCNFLLKDNEVYLKTSSSYYKDEIEKRLIVSKSKYKIE